MEKIEELSIGEFVATSEFQANMKIVLDQLEASRLKMANEARKRNLKLRRHPFDRLLEEEGELNASRMSDMFLGVMDKTLKKPAVIRDLIERIGLEAYKRTMQAEIKNNPKLKEKLTKFVK